MKAHWDFVINESRIGVYEGKKQPLYYNGYSCSNCRHGGGEVIPQEYGEITEEEARILFGDMNYTYCPNCGADMENGKEAIYVLTFDNIDTEWMRGESLYTWYCPKCGNQLLAMTPPMECPECNAVLGRENVK